MKPDKMEEDTHMHHLPGPGAQLCESEALNAHLLLSLLLGLDGTLHLKLSDNSSSEEDVRSMATRSKIMQNMLQPKVRSFSDKEGSLEELSDVDSQSWDVSQPWSCADSTPVLKAGGRGFPGAPQTSGDTSSTPASLTTAQDYVCALQGSHAICICCSRPTPDWRMQCEHEQEPHITPQQCTLCLQPFCHCTGAVTELATWVAWPSSVLNVGFRWLHRMLSSNN
ncbi:LOW QUALITY PROTEIN: hypothetical protein QTO34_000779 [Cnephaeus nilssonii]|uniref:E3 ubiquitin-protein ligase CHFR cysteine rich domain-containing protein n=1 Tax=Cnephaeus nilssonii TaxID=3371016 RepID=A0AA40LX80_CNENI|nr:LOW QUALITY PROTEIN: hypothetical protein QTO34_000779 [Eptesicus nilssonii]